MMKVDKDNCWGCCYCSVFASKVFKMGRDGKAEVISDEDVEIECPTGAISKV